MTLYKLTKKERDALAQAGNAMLAGEVGEGDAEGIKFETLDKAVSSLYSPIETQAARIRELEEALQAIKNLTLEWDSNKLGSVSLQRQRWQKCGEIACRVLEKRNP